MDSDSTPSLIHQSSSTAAAPLPTTIAVRNLFPPLTLRTAVAAPPFREKSHQETPGNEVCRGGNEGDDSSCGGNRDDTYIADYDENVMDLFDVERDNAIERELEEIKEILAESEKGGNAEVDFSSEDSNEIRESDKSDSEAAQDDYCNNDSSDDDGDDDDNSDTEKCHGNISSIATKTTYGKNFVPLGIEDRCAFVSREVLLPLRLEIVWEKGKQHTLNHEEKMPSSEEEVASDVDEVTKVGLEGDAKEEETIHVIYSKTTNYCTTHPRWDHLNEQLANTSITSIMGIHQKEDNILDQGTKCNESSDSSSAMEKEGTPASAATVTTIAKTDDPRTTSTETDLMWQNVYSDVYARIIILSRNNKQTDGEDGDTTTGELNERILSEVPLHPSKLQSLSGPNDSWNNFGDVEGRRNEMNNNMTIPSSLPPNAVLIHYTDGHTRVLPDLYDLLVKKGVIGGVSASTLSERRESPGEMNHQKDVINSRRFSDKVFDVLGAASGGDEQDGGVVVALKDECDRDHHKLKAPDSMYGNDKVFDLLGKSEDGVDSGIGSVPNPTNRDSEKAANSVFDDRAFALMGESAQVDCHEVDQMANTMADSSLSDEIVMERSTHDDHGDRGSEILVSPDGAVAMVKDQNVESSELSDSVMPALNEQITETVELELDPSSIVDKSSSPSSSPPRTPPRTTSWISPPITLLPPLPPTPTSPEVHLPSQRLHQVKGEVDKLKMMLQRERILFEQEQQIMIEETNRLKAIMSLVEQLFGEIEEMKRASDIERVHVFRSNFRLEARRISLLRKLQIVFPIKLIPIDIPHNITSFANPTATVGNANQTIHQYTIAGVPLPNDVHSPSVSDDQVSSALGFTCHLIALTSKYLGISLRYPIVCKFSRSAILDNEQRRIINGNGNGHKTTYAVYPLFRERVVEREQLDRGCELLNRNVECLLKMKDVEFRKDWNVLAKMDCLIMQLVEGEDLAFG